MWAIFNHVYRLLGVIYQKIAVHFNRMLARANRYQKILLWPWAALVSTANVASFHWYILRTYKTPWEAFKNHFSNHWPLLSYCITWFALYALLLFSEATKRLFYLGLITTKTCVCLFLQKRSSNQYSTQCLGFLLGLACIHILNPYAWVNLFHLHDLVYLLAIPCMHDMWQCIKAETQGNSLSGQFMQLYITSTLMTVVASLCVLGTPHMVRTSRILFKTSIALSTLAYSFVWLFILQMLAVMDRDDATLSQLIAGSQPVLLPVLCSQTSLLFFKLPYVVLLSIISQCCQPVLHVIKIRQVGAQLLLNPDASIDKTTAPEIKSAKPGFAP